jgi:hypothetical protein
VQIQRGQGRHGGAHSQNHQDKAVPGCLPAGQFHGLDVSPYPCITQEQKHVNPKDAQAMSEDRKEKALTG